MSKSFRYSPSYAIIFDNVNDFCIWSKWGPLASASYNFGRQLNTGFSVDIEPGNNAWKCAVVNNAAYEYYQMCEQTGILKPPPSLKIWVWKDIVVSSAPMLNTLVNSFNVSANGLATDFFSDIKLYFFQKTIAISLCLWYNTDVCHVCRDSLMSKNIKF